MYKLLLKLCSLQNKIFVRPALAGNCSKQKAFCIYFLGYNFLLEDACFCHFWSNLFSICIGFSYNHVFLSTKTISSQIFYIQHLLIIFAIFFKLKVLLVQMLPWKCSPDKCYIWPTKILFKFFNILSVAAVRLEGWQLSLG